eukprot:953844-Pleurochrysis_carterae.AAC.1
MAAGTAYPPVALPRADCSAWCATQAYTSDALDFKEDRLIKLDVAETDCSEPADVKQVDEVAAAALVDAE